MLMNSLLYLSLVLLLGLGACKRSNIEIKEGQDEGEKKTVVPDSNVEVRGRER